MATPFTTFVTTTTYGTWLPGDLRGWVSDGRIMPPDPKLLTHSRKLMSAKPVYLNKNQQHQAAHALIDAAKEFDYELTDLSMNTWHTHWILAHHEDSISTAVGRLKTRARQALDRGRILTNGYCHRKLSTPRDAENARDYIAKQYGVYIINGRAVNDRPESPGRAGG